MFQNLGKIGSDRIQPLYRNAKLAVIQSGSPGRGVRHIEKCLVCIKDDLDAGSRFRTKALSKLSVSRLKSGENLTAKCVRALASFVSQNEVPSLALGIIVFGSQFATGAIQQALNGSVGPNCD